MNGQSSAGALVTRASNVVWLLASCVVLALALHVGARSVGRAPAMGPFLDPAHGVWAVARTASLPRESSLALAGLTDSVSVRYDSRGVPHIFARNEADLMRAFGFVVARDRLFQLELQTRAVAGTLSELVGAAALEADREARAQGLAWGALNKWNAIPDTAENRRLVTAYADGINAYIAQMSRDDLPFEYRLLGATPQPWRPEYTYYLLTRMSLTLAWNDEELRRATVEALVGAQAADALFPVNTPIQEPIQPVPGRHAPRFAGGVLPPPAPTDSMRLAQASAFERATESSTLTALRGTGEIAVGSNNWAVAPSRTLDKRALLSGDPHLQLTLPSIWYEVHLQVPGIIDTYGVTIPGGPLIPIGFNRSTAWTATNTGADVLDYYQEVVNDPQRPTQYQLDGQWKPLTLRIETYRNKRGIVLRTDTMYHTHRGPMLRMGDRWLSRRWTALETSDEGRVLRLANHARSVDEWNASTVGYVVPAQNFLTADTSGHISIRSTGHYPLRPAGVKGNTITDGSKSANDWRGFWPLDRYPQSKDPAQGYLASANQQPKDPMVDPDYLGANWPAPFRAMRINALLRGDTAVTPDAMRKFQTDPQSEQTPLFLLPMFDAVDKAAAAGVADSFAVRGAALLREWDGRFTPENERAVLYDAMMLALTQRTWDELRSPNVRRTPTPSVAVLTQLMRDPSSVWWDVRATPSRETRDSVLVQSMSAAYQSVIDKHGPPGPRWRWSSIRTATINHMLRLPGLGRTKIPMFSGRGTLSPSDNDGTHGASWRFVVELAPQVRAWGTYPGGQSGNPISDRYDDRLALWTAGRLDSLQFPRTPAELSAPRFTLTLRPER